MSLCPERWHLSFEGLGALIFEQLMTSLAIKVGGFAHCKTCLQTYKVLLYAHTNYFSFKQRIWLLNIECIFCCGKSMTCFPVQDGYILTLLIILIA